MESVETYDRISGTASSIVTLTITAISMAWNASFGVSGWSSLDTEEFAAFSASQQFPIGTNIEASSHIPPVWTRTWFHTGVYLDREHISDFFAGLLADGNAGDYYREPGLTDAQARQLLLEDTALPTGLTLEEEREACRA